MFVCICNKINDKRIDELCHQAKSADDIFRQCGTKVKCGTCVPMIRDMVTRAKKE